MIQEIQRFSSWLELELGDDPEAALLPKPGMFSEPSHHHQTTPELWSPADADMKPSTEEPAIGGDASLLSSIINLAKTCVGTGILTLPFAFKGCGLLWGWVFTLLTGFMAAFTLFLLGEVATFGGRRPTLNAVGKHSLGSVGSVLVDLSVCMNNLGAMISYLVIASTTVQTIVQQNFALSGVAPWPRQVYVVIGIAIVAPLCLVRRVNMLRFSSSVAMVALTLVTIMIVLFAMPWSERVPAFQPCSTGTQCKGDVLLSTTPVDILTQFVIFTNAYTCQHAMLPIVAELERPTRSRRMVVIFGAMGAVCFLLLVVGTAGYLTFGDSVQSNVLFSYPHDSMLVVLALIGIIIDVLSSYPLLMFMTRISISNLIRITLEALGWSNPEWEPKPSPFLEPQLGPIDLIEDMPLEASSDSWRYIAVVSPMDWSDFISDRMDLIATALIMLFTIAVALAVSDLGIVAALTGATGATMIGYVVPGLLYVLLSRQHYSGENTQELISSSSERPKFVPVFWAYWGAVLILVLGCCLVPAGVTLTLISQ